MLSRVMLIGQAPGTKEPILGRPFAWTAGRKLFRWFYEATGMDEEAVRASIYFAAVCRCFPGKNAKGGDRVPAPDEIERCAFWMEREFTLLRPRLIIPVGKLAISQLLGVTPLDQAVGRIIKVRAGSAMVDAIPLPHPSGASAWPHQEPGKTLLAQALRLMAEHPAMLALSTARRSRRAKR